MKFNPKLALVNLDGSVIIEGGKPITIGIVAANALLTAPANAPLTAEQNVERYSLAMKIHNAENPSPEAGITAGYLDFTAEQIVLIKTAVVARNHGPILTGQLIKILDEK